MSSSKKTRFVKSPYGERRRTGRVGAGPNLTAEPALVMMAPAMIAPTTMDESAVQFKPSFSDTDGVGSAYLSLSALSESENKTKMESKLGDITTRLTKALDEFEEMYDASQDDQTLSDLSANIDGLESGELKYQMRNFIDRYKDIDHQLQDATGDKDEILSSLADLFTEAGGEAFELSFDEQEEAALDDSVRDGLLNARMGFEKLKRLNEEIVKLSTRGQSTSHLTREKVVLQKTVIAKFKAVRLAHKSKNIMKEHQRAHWKYAANEVVGLLKTIRSEGLANIHDLETKLQEILTIFEKQCEKAASIEVELNDQKQISAKWVEENAKLTNEAAFLKEELEQYRDKLVRLKKKLRQLQANGGAGETWSPDLDEMETFNTGRKYRIGQPESGYGAPGQDSFILKAQLRDCRQRAANFERENDALQLKLKDFEMDNEEKESIICALEMKHDEMRDECRKLERKIKRLESQVDAEKNGRPRPREPGEKPDHYCPQCRCHLHYRTNLSSNWVKLQSHVMETLKAAKAEAEAKKMEAKTVKVPAPQTKEQEPVDQKEEILRLVDQCEMLTRDLEETEANLNKAYKDIDALTEEKDTLIGQLDKAETAVKQAGRQTKMGTMTMQIIQQKKKQKNVQILGNRNGKETTAKGNLQSAIEEMSEVASQVDSGSAYSDPYDTKEVTNRKYEDEFEAMADAFGAEPTSNELIPMKRIREVRMPKSKQLMTMIEDIFVTHQAAQTDASFDALARTDGAAAGESADWAPSPVPRGQRRHSIAMAMMEGVDPLKLKVTATCTSTLVEKELERVINGITGFMDYTNNLIVEESNMMTQANDQLRTQLSIGALREITTAQTKYERTHQALTGNKGDAGAKEERTPPPVLTRGNFALAKGGARASKFADKGAFLTLGQRNHPPQRNNEMGAAFGKTDADKFKGYQRSRFDWQRKSLQGQLTISGHQMMEMLNDTVNMLTQNLKQQEKEYTILHNAVKRQKAREATNLDAVAVKASPVVPGGTKSTPPAGQVVTPNAQVSQSLVDGTESEISEAKEYLPPLLIHDGQKIVNRDELKVVKTTVPRKGMIKLHAEGVAPEKGVGGEEDASCKKKIRPTPLSHKKLVGKQRELQGKAGVSEVPTLDQFQRHILEFDDYMAAPKIHYINFGAGVSGQALAHEYPRGKANLPPLADQRALMSS